MPPPQAGHPTASLCHTWPAPTHRTRGAGEAAHTTIGIVGVGHHHRAGPVRGGPGPQAVHAASPSLGQHANLRDAVQLIPRQVEEHDHPRRGSRPPAGEGSPRPPPTPPPSPAASRPSPTRARPACWRRCRWWPPRRSRRRSGQPATIRVVVVLPLVPLISATRRPWAKVDRSDGSRASPTLPPATVPLPRPSARERRLVIVSASTANDARPEYGAGVDLVETVTPEVGCGPVPPVSGSARLGPRPAAGRRWRP